MTTKEMRREFKREVVVLLRDSGRPLTQIAAELGLEPLVLRRWCSFANGVGKTAPTFRRGGTAAAMLAEQVEIRHLRREQMERDVLKKQPASSGARRDEVPFYRGPPRGIPGAGHVFDAARQRQRLLCLAWQARKCLRPGEPGTGRGYQARACRQPALLRQPAGSYGPRVNG